MSSANWPALPFAEWESTCDTLHLWTQIIGKTRLALSPAENHFWHVALYVTPNGLTTSPIPFHNETFEVELDLLAHQLMVRTSEGKAHSIPLFPRSVADFYREYMSCLRSLGIDLHIQPTPVEFDDPTPFDEDHHHAAYDTQYVERFRRILINCDRLLKQFRCGFVGKCSPVHFFWGSFDMAVTRFCGRRATLPSDVDPLTREAYSHAVISCGFWPGDRKFPHPALYSYTKPTPAGLEQQKVRPDKAYWDPQLSEFILKYEDLRTAASPEQDFLAFCESTYEAGAKLADWDRGELERG